MILWQAEVFLLKQDYLKNDYKNEIDNLNFIKMKTFVYQKTAITQWKDKPHTVICVFDKDIYPDHIKEHQQFNNRNSNKPKYKMGNEPSKCTLQKRISNWKINTWKDV